eukprot:450823_1
MRTYLLFAFLFLGAPHTYSFDDNWDKCGVCQIWSQMNKTNNSLGSYPYIATWDPLFYWSEIEPVDNQFNFSLIDKTLQSGIKQNKNISFLLNIFAGNAAPLWIYDKPWNIPQVNLTNTNNNPWPYYPTNNYSFLYKRFLNHTYKYVLNYNAHSTSNKIFAVQAMFGCTGDDRPWNGNPINESYNITADEWWEIEKPWAKYICNLYNNGMNSTFPNLLLLFNFGENLTRINWQIENCPGSYRKEGMVSHGYQLNYEYLNYSLIGNGNPSIWMKQNNVTIRYRGELSYNSYSSGYYQQAPLWNTLSIVEWALTFGMDMINFEIEMLNNYSYWKIFDFHRKYGGLKTKDGNRSIGAWIHLRDGLDSNNTQRFPESIYGINEYNGHNAQRMINIANAFSEYGAKQEDPSAAKGKPRNQRNAQKMNDVGWGIWNTNYGMFMKQINAINTSIGYWRIGDINQIYGRFGRGFDYKNGMNIICFQLNKDLWNGLPLKNEMNVTIEINYFDNGINGMKLFSFGYDNKNNDKCSNDINHKIIANGTYKWQTVYININDGYFGNRCNMNADFCLFNLSKQNVIFSFIHIYKD